MNGRLMILVSILLFASIFLLKVGGPGITRGGAPNVGLGLLGALLLCIVIGAMIIRVRPGRR